VIINYKFTTLAKSSSLDEQDIILSVLIFYFNYRICKKTFLKSDRITNHMENLFVLVRYAGKIELGKQIISKLPKKVGLVGTAQFVHQLPAIKEQLEKNGISVFLEKGFQPQKGQLLGCDVSSASKIKDKVDGFLYIGDGQFHPLGLGSMNKNVFCYNPYIKKFYKLDLKQVELLEKRKKGALISFLSADRIGILVSLKEGQHNLRKALTLKEKLEKKEKKAYILVFDTLNFNDMENFPFVQCFVNTACPRIMDDYDKFQKPVINFAEAFKAV